MEAAKFSVRVTSGSYVQVMIPGSLGTNRPSVSMFKLPLADRLQLWV
jgi:hypothetical protein